MAQRRELEGHSLAVGAALAVGSFLAFRTVCKVLKPSVARSLVDHAFIPHNLRHGKDKLDPEVLARLELALLLALQAGLAIKQALTATTRAIEKKGDFDLVTATDKDNEKLILESIKHHFPEDQFIGEEGSTAAGHINALTNAATWVTDPIDGTTNFVHGFPMTCVSIGIAINKRIELGVVYNPCTEEMFLAARGGGAWLNGRRVKASGCTNLHDSIVITEYGYQREPKSIQRMVNITGEVLKRSRAIRQLGSGALDLCYIGCGRCDALYAGVAGEGWKPWDYAAGWLFAEEGGATVKQVDGKPFDLFANNVLCCATEALALELIEVINPQ